MQNNFYLQPYETAAQQTLNYSKSRSSTATLSPQPASTAGGSTKTGQMQPEYHSSGLDMSHHLAKRNYPHDLLYVKTDTEPHPGYNGGSSMSSRVNTEDMANGKYFLNVLVCNFGDGHVLLNPSLIYVFS